MPGRVVPAPPSVQTMAVPRCPICEAAGDIVHEGIRDNSSCTANLWSFRRCTNPRCRHYWLDPAPTPDELHLAYKDYGPHKLPGPAVAYKPTPLGRVYTLLLRTAGVLRRRRRMRLYHLPKGQGRRVLEIGCGNGSRLVALRDHGWNAEGQDVSPVAVEAARQHAGVTVHHGPIENLALSAGGYDVVAMNHVLEHVEDPVSLLRNIHLLLRPGGLLVSIHPNGSSLQHRFFGHGWVGLDAPRHLHAFTLSSTRKALRKSGFERISLRSSSVGSEFWIPMSAAFRRFNLHQPTLSPKKEKTAGAVGQLLSFLAYAVSPRCGEELIVRAVKEQVP